LQHTVFLFLRGDIDDHGVCQIHKPNETDNCHEQIAAKLHHVCGFGKRKNIPVSCACA